MNRTFPGDVHIKITEPRNPLKSNLFYTDTEGTLIVWRCPHYSVEIDV